MNLVDELASLAASVLVARVIESVVQKQAEDEAMQELVEAVTAAAKVATWAIEGKRVILSREVRARIADRVADGELPGDLAYKAYKAGWPAEVATAVARYGRAVQRNVVEGRGVNKFWGDVAVAA